MLVLLLYAENNEGTLFIFSPKNNSFKSKKSFQYNLINSILLIVKTEQGDAMANNNKLKAEDLQKITREEIAEELQNILSSKVAVYRKNKEGRFVTIPAEKLEQFIGAKDEGASFLIEKVWKSKIKEAIALKEKSEKKEPEVNTEELLKPAKEAGRVEDQVKRFTEMSVEEREGVLDDGIEKLHNMAGAFSKLDLSYVVKMIEVIANTFYASHANLQDNLSQENLKYNLNGVYAKTEWVVQLIVTIFNNENISLPDIKIINKINTGSPTIDHMTKVFLWYVNFCIFINNYIDKGLITKKIRGGFKDKYSRYYKRKLDIPNLSIEGIVKNGFRRIEIDTELKAYALGALLADIGKIPDIGYHDGDAPFDENTVKKHAVQSYNMISKAKIYPFISIAMAAFHHEYYGNGIYNFSNPLISKLTGEKRTEDNANYFMTLDEAEFRNGVALAFFPVKLLEIIDIHDALNE